MMSSAGQSTETEQQPVSDGQEHTPVCPPRLGVLQRQLGGYGPATVKPNSITRWAIDGGSVLKIYRCVSPHERRRREVEALTLAADWGFSVPRVLATGEQTTHAWTVLSTVPGKPCSFDTAKGIQHYLCHVVSTTERLHSQVVGLPPGAGWTQQKGDANRGNSRFLLDQMSLACRRLPWWGSLEASLEPCDALPTVYLHGDLKPDHLLFDGSRLHVLDWEASGRGPASSDHADAIFHLIRDLIYSSVPVHRIPVGLVSQLPVPGAVLAWRLALWLDRRRAGDILLLPSHDLYQLVAEDDPAAACAELARTIAHLRAAGVPR
ncbi:aminoglycoside phosphotransferase family protein [Streptomyces sp. NPDC001651]|uniref:aminoglycoside phosphotransferase family protein n=1 Tax=Streptomyces sp. NPDC001651 TaxID=3364596 RepID=UPI003698E93D